MNIYIGNLSYNANEDDITSLFSSYGDVSSVRIIKDRITQKPRGFAFVEMSSDDDAQKAIDTLNGQDFLERKLVINQAHEKKNRSNNRFRDGGGNRGRRNYDSGNRQGGYNRDSSSY